MAMKSRIGAAIALALSLAALAESAMGQLLPGRARLVLIFVVDGLRPDAVTPDDTPAILRLRQEGVHYVNAHAVFPTVTRVNATALATGVYPAAHGIMGNVIYVPEVNPTRAVTTADFKNLLRLDEKTGGRMVFVKTLGERLQERGLKLAVVSSGSTGSALLLNPRAPKGVGVLVNGYLEPGKLVAWPPVVNADVLARFGPAPTRRGAVEHDNAAVDWAGTVLREYVLPQLRPDVVVNWLTEPDHIQHGLGAGAPEAREAIRNSDRNVGLVLRKLEALGLADQTDVFVVSDHGFGQNVFGVNVTQELITAGLKTAPDSDDVIVASSGQTILLHVKDRDSRRIAAIVRFLQGRDWTGVIFTAAARAGDSKGRVEGTFSLALIHAASAERGPDIVFTFPWTSARNRHGVPGSDYVNTTATGPLTGPASNHGSMSPWNVRNTFIAWGVDFKRGARVPVPAGNIDVTPTILALKGVDGWQGLDGRLLREALRDGPDEEQVVVETRSFNAEAAGGAYRAVIQVSEVDGKRYVDKSWRVK